MSSPYFCHACSAALLPFAQLLAPFLVFEPNKPMAHVEIGEVDPFAIGESPRALLGGREPRD